MRKFHTHVDEIKVDTTIPQNAQLLWQNNKLTLYYTYDSKEGRVNWIMQNKTNSSILVSLLRGAELNINGQTYTIPEYLFGNAFAEVYFANNLSNFITDLNNIPLYSLAIMKNKNDNRTIAFIFQIPANSIIIAPEYGFRGLQSLNGQLLEITPISKNLFGIVYDFAEIVEYEYQTGILVNYPPDPYMVQSYQFLIDNLGQIVTQRLILEIPESDINAVKSLVSDFQKVIDKLKKIF
jgi:hypothetical protein